MTFAPSESSPAELGCLLAAMVLIAARCTAQFRLTQLNHQHVRAQAGKVPEALCGVMDEATYRRSVDYTLAGGRLSQIDNSFDALALLLVLFSGVLPWSLRIFQEHAGNSAWTMAGFLFAVGVVMAVAHLPLDWYDQFKHEARFGFNTTTPQTWWLDRAKTFLLALLLGYPLLVLILKLVEWTGAGWWLWAWSSMMGFQLLMMVIAPVLILPLFNKFTPLPDGPLRERLLQLAGRTKFRARSIQVMDGSKRSRHSNAFFMGLGRFRKIVLFDTLIAQLSEPELEAVLAHEIGHYQRKHIPKLIAWSALLSLAAFATLGLLARQDWFYGAFGFAPGNVTPALLLFALLAGPVTFWLSPLQNWWARKFEYEADAFAANAVGAGQPLVTALRKLHEKNLSNLTPHPAYSGFYYSHPTLLERERALSGRTVEIAPA